VGHGALYHSQVIYIFFAYCRCCGSKENSILITFFGPAFLLRTVTAPRILRSFKLYCTFTGTGTWYVSVTENKAFQLLNVY
jgi:hypothetical protein